MKVYLIAAGKDGPPPGALLDPGASVLCSQSPDAVDLAKRWFPDQAIKVSRAYAEPKIGQGLWARLSFALGKAPEDETHEELKRRVVEAAVALVDGAKKREASAFIGGPLMIRLLGYKLASIGYHGPLLSPVRPLIPREYRF